VEIASRWKLTLRAFWVQEYSRYPCLPVFFCAGFNLGYGSVQAIYLDDQLSQQYVIGNTVIDSDAGACVSCLNISMFS
jgi:hypothetical protein